MSADILPSPAADGATTLSVPRPYYPRSCRLAGHQGRCLIDVDVLLDGSAGDARVIQSAGCAELDRSACAAAAKARFRPAVRDGGAVASRETLSFRFVLEGE